MKVNVTTQIKISSNAHAVFKYLTDLKYIHLWNPQLTYVSSKEKLKLGSKYQTTTQVLGVNIESNNVVSRFQQDEFLQIDNTTGMVQFAAAFEIKEQADSVMLKCITSVSSTHKAFAFSGSVLKILARRELQADLQALKIAVEQKLPATTF